eukprot:1567941-Alexandrium_andersonii.AAC.1
MWLRWEGHACSGRSLTYISLAGRVSLRGRVGPRAFNSLASRSSGWITGHASRLLDWMGLG